MESVKGEMLPVSTALVDSVLGYLVVFIGLALLMLVIILVGKVMVSSAQRAAARTAKVMSSTSSAPLEAEMPVQKPQVLAPGSAGEVKIYDTDPRDAAMIMAIVADKLQKPLNELRFVSIKEVK